MQVLNASLHRLAWAAPLVLRLVLGGLFVAHGIDKFDTGLGAVEGAFDGWGVPAAAVTAPLTAVLEVVLGLALLAGLVTRVGSLVLAIVLVGAIVFVKAEVGLLGGAETDLAYLAGLLTLALVGPGPLSVDAALGLDPAAAAERDPGRAPAVARA